MSPRPQECLDKDERLLQVQRTAGLRPTLPPLQEVARCADCEYDRFLRGCCAFCGRRRERTDGPRLGATLEP